MKIHSQDILSIRVEHDSTVPSNYRMYTFDNVGMVVPFAVVFSDAGKDTNIMITNSEGNDCYVPIPTRIMDKLCAQVYASATVFKHHAGTGRRIVAALV